MPECGLVQNVQNLHCEEKLLTSVSSQIKHHGKNYQKKLLIERVVCNEVIILFTFIQNTPQQLLVLISGKEET